MPRDDYDQLFIDAGKRWNVDPLLLKTMADIESSFRPGATNPSGAAGLMGFMPPTANQYGVNVFDPASSIDGAGHYLSDLLTQYNGNVDAALNHYSGRNPKYGAEVASRYGTFTLPTSEPAAPLPPGPMMEPQRINDLTKEAGFGTRFGQYEGGAPQGMIIHHTGGPAGGVPVKNVLNVYRQTGYPAPFIIDRDGEIYQAIPEGYRGQHIRKGSGPTGTGKSNANMTGVEIIAADDSDVLPVQTKAAANLYAQQAAKYGWQPGSLYGHGEVNPPPHRQLTEGMSTVGGIRSGTLPIPVIATNPPPAPPEPPPAPSPEQQPIMAEKPKFDAAAAERAILEGKPAATQFDPAATEEAILSGTYQPPPAPADAGYGNPYANVVFPAAQNLYEGVNQGFRDIDTFGSRVDSYLADRFPLYGKIANAVGSNPAHLQQLEGETKAYEQKQKDNFNYAAPVGRFVGEVAPTLPFSGPAAAVGGAVRTALPYVGRVLGPALEGGTMGAIGNLLTSQGKTPEEWAGDALHGFGVGGALGGALGGGKGLLAVKANPADQAIADRLGVTMSSGQMAGGPLKWLESATEHMPGSGATKFAGQQRQQIADVVAREAGIPTGAPITTGTLETARGRIGQAIEDSSRGINVVATPQLAAEVQSIRDMALMQGPTTNEAHVFKELSDRLGNIIANNNGQLPGPEFQNFIRRGGPLDAAIRSRNGDVSQIGSRLKEALLDAGEAGGAGSQQAIADMQKARYQWKVTQTVAPLMERTPTGSEAMNLPGLAQAIRREFGTAGTGPGHEMKDLSRLISGPLRDLPSSGTAQRAWWQDALSAHALSGPIGATAIFAGAPIAHAIASALAGPLAIGATMGRGLRYGVPGGDAMLNRLLPASVTNLLSGRPEPPT